MASKVNVLDAVIDKLSEGVDISPPPLDERLIALASKQLDVDEDLMSD